MGSPPSALGFHDTCRFRRSAPKVINRHHLCKRVTISQISGYQSIIHACCLARTSTPGRLCSVPTNRALGGGGARGTVACVTKCTCRVDGIIRSTDVYHVSNYRSRICYNPPSFQPVPHNLQIVIIIANIERTSLLQSDCPGPDIAATLNRCAQPGSTGASKLVSELLGDNPQKIQRKEEMISLSPCPGMVLFRN